MASRIVAVVRKRELCSIDEIVTYAGVSYKQKRAAISKIQSLCASRHLEFMVFGGEAYYRLGPAGYERTEPYADVGKYPAHVCFRKG